MLLSKKIVVQTFCIYFTVISINSYADDTSELILKLLIKKGIITQEEVDGLKAEIKKSGEKGAGSTEEAMKEHVKKSSWSEKIKVKGDLRFRNDYQRPCSGTYVNRQRIRARVGLEAKILDNLEGGIGLATGGTSDTSGRSTNQSLQRAFSIKAFDLDMAYLTWKPYEFVTLGVIIYA